MADTKIIKTIAKIATIVGAGLTSSALLALAPASAATAAQPPDFMAIGAPAKPPMGYLNFCARRPDQCGLASGDFNASQEAVSDRQRQLYSLYFWPLVFGDQNAALEDWRPTAGDARDFWTGGFGLYRRASSAPRVSPDIASIISPGDQRPSPTPELMRLLGSVNDRINHSIRYIADRALYGVDDYWTLPLDPGGYAAGDCKDYVLEKRRALVEAGLSPSMLSIAIVRTHRRETHAVLLVATDRGELVLDSLSSSIRPWRKTPYDWIERQAPGQQLSWVTIPRTPALS
jgi:predicted transglutaminase-like cysteine proteinase